MHVVDTYKYNDLDDKNMSKSRNVDFCSKAAYSVLCDQIWQNF